MIYLEIFRDILVLVSLVLSVFAYKISKKVLNYKTVDAVDVYPVGFKESNLTVKISNRSDKSIHNVVVISTHTKSDNNYIEELKRLPYKTFSSIPPGETTIEIYSHGNSAGGDSPAVSMLFTDANKNEWYITAGSVHIPVFGYKEELFKIGDIPPFTQK